MFRVTKGEVWSSTLHEGTVLREVPALKKMVQHVDYSCPGTGRGTKWSCEWRRRLSPPKMQLY